MVVPVEPGAVVDVGHDRNGYDPIGQLARRWVALAPVLRVGDPEQLDTVLRRLARLLHGEPYWPLAARPLGADLLGVGLGAEEAGLVDRAEDLIAPSLALLRRHAPVAFGCADDVGVRRLEAALDEMVAGFVAALRERHRRELDGAVAGLPRPGRPWSADQLARLPTRPVPAPRHALLPDLVRGIRRGEFRLAYQPLVQLADGRLDGAEALVRWQHPEQGLLGPATFIALAEQSGAIVDLGRWVLEEACAQAVRWAADHGPDAPYVSVNVSPVQVAQPSWAADVLDVLAATGLPPRLLQLEITEQVVLAEGAGVVDALRTLRGAGVRLALDDFGTGYSGLARLRHLPVHVLKIDGAFIDGLRHPAPDATDTSIVRALVEMAHAVGLEVTAEWVETDVQADRLAALGCDVGQGRWFGDAGPAGSVMAMARRSITH